MSLESGIVKLVQSGDTVVLRKPNDPRSERTISLSNVIAPKLARRQSANVEESQDEPWAWEAREFVRKKIIGKPVWFTVENSPAPNRGYGVIKFGKTQDSAVNLTELLVSEGLVSVRSREGARQSETLQRLLDLESTARSEGKGKWGSSDPKEHVRDVKWTPDLQAIAQKYKDKPVKAIIENVRDGNVVRAFLLPDFYYVQIMIAGIKCSEDYVNLDEVRNFIEFRLLQQEVEVVVEVVNNNNIIGTIKHPQGNIAESLLREGYARCVDWSMTAMKSGAGKLREAEAIAKKAKKRLWKDHQSNAPQIAQKDKDLSGIVVEVVNGDALMVKQPNGQVRKVFLASIRPPGREKEKVADADGNPIAPAPVRQTKEKIRPLYDIPWMFEAREFLRKKLIGKKVTVTVDYIQPAKDSFPTKHCCTVISGGVNVAQTLVSKGLATVVKYRQQDDERSSNYYDLLDAEKKAQKTQVGVHAKKDIPTHRVTDIVGDVQKAKSFLPFLQRAKRTEAVVEFVTSGSRLRLFIPKESCLVTFLLGGISCPRGARPAMGKQPATEGEPFGDEAMVFTKEKCLQREVEIQVESLDKVGNFIGWLWVDNVNLSVALVESGYAAVHPTADRSEYYRALVNAEDQAKAKKLNRWKDYVEDDREESRIEEDKVVERKINQEKVVVTEVTDDGHFYAQNVEQGAKLVSLMAKIRQEFQASPPTVGAYTPKRGDICAAKFDDNEWYRAKVEKVEKEGKVAVFYIDYGNRQVIPSTRCASLPSAFSSDKPYAQEYTLACVTLPSDQDYVKESLECLKGDILDQQLLLNVEYKNGTVPAVTLQTMAGVDIIKRLVTDGLFMVENRKEKRLAKLMGEYRAAQDQAKKNRYHIWEYGDITEDDAKEFGA